MLGGLGGGGSGHRQRALVGEVGTILNSHTLSLKWTVAEKPTWSSGEREGG